MLRRLFTILSAMSLLLCLSACVLWATSYLYPGRWSGAAAGGLLVQGGSARGRAALSVVHEWPHTLPWQWEPVPFEDTSATPRATIIVYMSPSLPGLGVKKWEQWGMRGWYGRVTTNLDRDSVAPLMPGWSVAAPHWMSVAVASGFTIAWITGRLAHRRRRRRRNGAGRCTICGYDLRASPNRCPECGAVSTELKGTRV